MWHRGRCRERIIGRSVALPMGNQGTSAEAPQRSEVDERILHSEARLSAVQRFADDHRAMGGRAGLSEASAPIDASTGPLWLSYRRGRQMGRGPSQRSLVVPS